MVCFNLNNFICPITEKSKIPKPRNSEENSKDQWQNQKLKHIKRMDNNCPISDFVQTFSNETVFGITEYRNLQNSASAALQKEDCFM